MRKYAILLLIFGLSQQSWGAVAFGNSNTAVSNPAASLDTLMTANAGTNLVCFAFFEWDGAGATDNISGITYAGTTMTAVGSSSSGSNAFNKAYYIINPTTGSNHLVATMTGASEVYFAFDCYTGVDQTTPVRPGTYQNTTSASAANPSLTITSNASDISVTNISDGTGLSGTNQTQNFSNVGGTLEMYGDRATTPASSVTHTWTMASGAYRMLGFSIQTVQAAATAQSLNVVPGSGNISILPGTGNVAIK